MALQENQLEDSQVKWWFLILTSSHLLCNSLSSWFFNWAGWIPGNPETGPCLSFKNLIRVFFAACSVFPPHSNSLPLFCLTGTRWFAHSSVLKYRARAYFYLEWKEQSLPQHSPCHKQQGRKDSWVSIHLDATGFSLYGKKKRLW